MWFFCQKCNFELLNTLEICQVEISTRCELPSKRLKRDKIFVKISKILIENVIKYIWNAVQMDVEVHWS